MTRDWKNILFGSKKYYDEDEGRARPPSLSQSIATKPNLERPSTALPTTNAPPTSRPRHRQHSFDTSYNHHRNDSYDIVEHARSSLQIDGRSRYGQPYASASSASSATISAAQPLAWPVGPTYTPARALSPPKGPRLPMSECLDSVPDIADLWSTPSASKSGGFAHPSLAERSSPTRLPSDPRCHRPSPTRYDNAPPYPNHGPVSPFHALTPPARPYTVSTPPRTSKYLQTSPPPFASRPYSTPNVNLGSDKGSSKNKPNKHLPELTPLPGSCSASPTASSSTPFSSSSKANQCRGTTGQGKRCTRIVGKNGNSSKKVTASPYKSPQKAKDKTIQATHSSSSARLTSSALRQLDRRLSIGKSRHGHRKPVERQRRIIEVDSDSEEQDDDIQYARSGKGRINPIKEEEDAGESGEELEELPVYCFQHAKQALEQKGTFNGSEYIDFDSWIPDYLPQEIKLQLRHEISKPISADDTAGYIYVHEMAEKDTNTSSTTFIKLGRSIHPVARLSQWKSQCRSRQPIVRDIFPLHPSHPLHPHATASSLLNHTSPSRIHGALSFAAQGAAHHHRWERLCLIELAGISALQAEARNQSDYNEEIKKQRCSDCGKIHVELFMLNKGAYEDEVRSLVLRWQRFVESVA